MKNASPARACGIDFGTSNSTVGWHRPGSETLIALEEGKITLPSVIFFNFEERRPVYGRLALHEYLEGRATVLAVFAQFVVFGALVGIAQRFVGLAGFLELVLGVLFLADVGVIFTRKLAVGGLDRLLVRRRLDAQNLVVVFEIHLSITINERMRAARAYWSDSATHGKFIGCRPLDVNSELYSPVDG